MAVFDTKAVAATLAFLILELRFLIDLFDFRLLAYLSIML
jgi:hypothetical protein